MSTTRSGTTGLRPAQRRRSRRLGGLEAAQVASRSPPSLTDSTPSSGDRRYRLPGEERQRLAVARLLLKAPAVVVLDEATARLDSESKVARPAALDPALDGRTSLVIAQPNSGVRRPTGSSSSTRVRIVGRGRPRVAAQDEGEPLRRALPHPVPRQPRPAELPPKVADGSRFVDESRRIAPTAPNLDESVAAWVEPHGPRAEGPRLRRHRSLARSRVGHRQHARRGRHQGGDLGRGLETLSGASAALGDCPPSPWRPTRRPRVPGPAVAAARVACGRLDGALVSRRRAAFRRRHGAWTRTGPGGSTRGSSVRCASRAGSSRRSAGGAVAGCCLRRCARHCRVRHLQRAATRLAMVAKNAGGRQGLAGVPRWTDC